jgi:hypothetical protein
MTLLPPAVIGPLSECSSSVRVQGQLIGATVRLVANGVPVGSGVATWTDQVFPLAGGAALAPGANVTATQSLAGVTSPPSPQPVIVQKKPPTIGHVGLKTHVYACGQCLWLDGMVPGATVEVTAGGAPRGSGTAADGSARISLSAPTLASDTLVATQTACGIAGLPTPLPAPDPLPGEKGQLAPPTVEAPLRACQRAVTVSNVIDGARVILQETLTPGFTEQACFDLPTLWFPVPPLKAGASVSAVQTMPGCHLKSPPSASVPVGPATPVPVPVVVPPLCAGSVSVRVDGLLPGSPVEIFEGSTSLGTGSAPASTFDFPVPPLSANATITARQELCSNWSAPSAGVKVNPKPASLPTPAVMSPLYECGAAVHVSNLHPGSSVYVYSVQLGGPIGYAAVYATQADVLVAPQLIKGDHVYAVQHGCGLVSSQSAAVLVQPLGKPGPPEIVSPVEDCMKSVTVADVIPGAHVDVYVNGAWRGSAVTTAATVEVPILFGPLHVGDQVRARQIICGLVLRPGEPVTVVSSAGFYYPTQHFDVARTGWFPYETSLSVATVPGLTQKFTHQVDGTVYAQPLYAHHVNIPGSGAHNVIYIATENDSVYAFDADTSQSPLWQRSLIPPGESVVSTSDVQGCNNVAPVIGVTSTPVMNCATGTIYVVAKTKRGQGGQTTFHQRLHALDMTTGADRIAPADIQGSVPGTSSPGDGHGHVVFDPHWHLNRPGLLLLNGTIYIGFGSHCDAHLPSYHGWVFGYDATTLQRVGVFSTTPDTPVGSTSAAGVWQGGMGLAADSSGFVYFTTGNGDLNANLAGGRDYGDCVVKLRNNFTVADFFAPSDQPALLANDIDLGSGGVLVLPDPPAGTNLLHLVVAAGKDGNAFLLDRENNMGKYTQGGPDHVVQTLQLVPGAPITNPPGPGVWGGPAYYRDANQQFVYYCASGRNLCAYIFSGAALTLSMIGPNPNQSPQAFPGEGGVTPNVSSSGQNPGTGVVWAITRSNPLRLQAFDATDLTNKLFESACGPWHNANGGPFIEPTTIHGKVYVPSDGQITVFGL